MNRGEVVAGVVLGALGGYIVSEAARWDYLAPEGPGPGFFPLWYGAVMVALSAVLVWQGATAPAQGAERRPVRWSEVRRVFAVWASFVACIALLQVLGFVLGFAAFVLSIVALMYGKPWPVAAAVAAGCSAGFYLLFSVALDVRLPAGALGF